MKLTLLAVASAVSLQRDHDPQAAGYGSGKTIPFPTDSVDTRKEADSYGDRYSGDRPEYKVSGPSWSYRNGNPSLAQRDHDPQAAGYGSGKTIAFPTDSVDTRKESDSYGNVYSGDRPEYKVSGPSWSFRNGNPSLAQRDHDPQAAGYGSGAAIPFPTDSVDTRKESDSYGNVYSGDRPEYKVSGPSWSYRNGNPSLLQTAIEDNGMTVDLLQMEGIDKKELMQNQPSHFRKQWPQGIVDDSTNDDKIMFGWSDHRKKKVEPKETYPFTLEDDIVASHASLAQAEGKLDHKMSDESAKNGGMDMIFTYDNTKRVFERNTPQGNTWHKFD